MISETDVVASRDCTRRLGTIKLRTHCTASTLRSSSGGEACPYRRTRPYCTVTRTVSLLSSVIPVRKLGRLKTLTSTGTSTPPGRGGGNRRFNGEEYKGNTSGILDMWVERVMGYGVPVDASEYGVCVSRPSMSTALALGVWRRLL
ncbi:hypothetical protein Tco_0128626 [Tanacetum coccineum]